MAQLYQRFLRVLQKWPADENRLSKTLGVHLREQGKIVFDKRGEFTGNRQDCERRMASLERIARDHWASKYPRSRNSSATGFTAEECKKILTKETVQEIELYMKKPAIYRWFLDIFGKKN